MEAAAFLPPPGVTPNFVDPSSTGPELVRTSLVTGGITLAVVVARWIIKLSVTKNVGWDDCE